MSENSKENPTQQELILSDQFENALISAAEVKTQKMELCKSRNKDNYSRFYDIILMSRHDIRDIMEMPKKNRTDDDTRKIKEFKKSTSYLYKTICDVLQPEELEDGEDNKFQKMVKKVATIVKMMEYIGHTEINDEFAKYGITLNYTKLDSEDAFSNEYIKKDVTEVFDNGKTIKEEIEQNKEEIKTVIYENSVPIDLQFDKSMNPTGITKNDFCKMVDIKAKLMKAKDNEDEQEKAKEIAQNIAGDIIFQNKRNEILNRKYVEIAS